MEIREAFKMWTFDVFCVLLIILPSSLTNSLEVDVPKCNYNEYPDTGCDDQLNRKCNKVQNLCYCKEGYLVNGTSKCNRIPCKKFGACKSPWKGECLEEEELGSTKRYCKCGKGTKYVEKVGKCEFYRCNEDCEAKDPNMICGIEGKCSCKIGYELVYSKCSKSKDSNPKEGQTTENNYKEDDYNDSNYVSHLSGWQVLLICMGVLVLFGIITLKFICKANKNRGGGNAYAGGENRICNRNYDESRIRIAASAPPQETTQRIRSQNTNAIRDIYNENPPSYDEAVNMTTQND